jgi:hypothetical protein
MSSLHTREDADDSHGELHIQLSNSKHCHFGLGVHMSKKEYEINFPKEPCSSLNGFSSSQMCIF